MRRPRLLFVSWHFYLDHSNGASISARELLLGLSRRGWDVKTFCGPIVDNPGVSDVRGVLKRCGVPFVENEFGGGSLPFSLVRFNDDGIQSVVCVPEKYTRDPNFEARELFLRLLNHALQKTRAEIVPTYGGGSLCAAILRTIHFHGAKSVFLLQNFCYDDPRLFDDVDLTIVPSQYSAEYYRRKLGIATSAVPPPIRLENAGTPSSDESRRYALYVNSSPNKGVYLFAKIAVDLWTRRPEIPFLVVESCSSLRTLLATGADFRGVNNINLTSGTPNPAEFYRLARLTLVPSFFDESFGRVAAESMSLGVPVVASNRGTLPETIGDAGSLLSIPDKYSPSSRILPSSIDVAPWIREIERLWDDSNYYVELRRRGLRRAARWNESAVLNQYENLLRALLKR